MIWVTLGCLLTTAIMCWMAIVASGPAAVLRKRRGDRIELNGFKGTVRRITWLGGLEIDWDREEV